jgi:hypothetical protein
MTTTMATPDAPATEKQIAYIASLVDGHQQSYRRTVRDMEHRRQTSEAHGSTVYEGRELARYEANHAAAALLAALWGTVALPTERMTQRQASSVIERLKGGTAAATVTGEWLDNPKMARTYGVADFIEANRDAIERALKLA